MDVITRIFALVGGGGVLIIGLWALFGKALLNWLKEGHRKQTELELESTRQHYGLRRIQADKFAGTQYEKYMELWEALQDLRLTVDALWDNATESNVVKLARQLRDTKRTIERWSLFFERHHMHELRRILRTLEEFEAGKRKLRFIRSRKDFLGAFLEEDVRYQIEMNRNSKEEFEILLDQVEESFRNKLTRLDEDDTA